MIIETERYRITGGHDFKVEIKSIVEDSPQLKNKDKIGEVTYSSPTYYPTLEMAYTNLAKRIMLTDDDITSFERIIDMLNKFHDDVKALGNE